MMTTKLPILSLFVILLLVVFSCNPDCTDYSTISADIFPEYRQAGDQIQVSTQPADFLIDKDLFVEKTVNNGVEFEELESTYYPQIEARIATLPQTQDIIGNKNIYIKDNDCGGFIPLQSLNVVNQDFINSNLSLFIGPSPPQIIVPQSLVTPPVNVINTWFSPTDRRYCILVCS